MMSGKAARLLAEIGGQDGHAQKTMYASVSSASGGSAVIDLGAGEQTPARALVKCSAGDRVTAVRMNDGSWAVTGNVTSPVTDDARAQAAFDKADAAASAAEQAGTAATEAKGSAADAKTAADAAKAGADAVKGYVGYSEDAAKTLAERVEASEGAITAIEGNVTRVEGKADDAIAGIGAAEARANKHADDAVAAVEAAYKAADTAIKADVKAVDDAYKAADAAIKGDVDAVDAAYRAADTAIKASVDAVDAAYKAADAEMKTDIAKAQKSADDAQKAADAAEGSAREANAYASGALSSLSTVQDVLGALNWAADNAEFERTSDTELTPGKTYWARSGSGTDADPYKYAPVASPTEAGLSGYYEISGAGEAMADYVSSHLAVTDEGLWVLSDGAGYRLLLSSDGARIIDPAGVAVATYGVDVMIGRADDTHTTMDKSSFVIWRADDKAIAIEPYGEPRYAADKVHWRVVLGPYESRLTDTPAGVADYPLFPTYLLDAGDYLTDLPKGVTVEYYSNFYNDTSQTVTLAACDGVRDIRNYALVLYDKGNAVASFSVEGTTIGADGGRTISLTYGGAAFKDESGEEILKIRGGVSEDDDTGNEGVKGVIEFGSGIGAPSSDGSMHAADDFDSLRFVSGKTIPLDVRPTGTYVSDLISEGEVYAGAMVRVQFTYANTAAAPTLDVNSTGAKAIYAGGAAASSTNKLRWKAGSVLEFMYDGAYWVFTGFATSGARETPVPTFVKSSWSASSDESTLPVTPCFVLDASDGGLYWCSGA